MPGKGRIERIYIRLILQQRVSIESQSRVALSGEWWQVRRRGGRQHQQPDLTRRLGGRHHPRRSHSRDQLQVAWIHPLPRRSRSKVAECHKDQLLSRDLVKQGPSKHCLKSHGAIDCLVIATSFFSFSEFKVPQGDGGIEEVILIQNFQ